MMNSNYILNFSWISASLASLNENSAPNLRTRYLYFIFSPIKANNNNFDVQRAENVSFSEAIPRVNFKLYCTEGQGRELPEIRAMLHTNS